MLDYVAQNAAAEESYRVWTSETLDFVFGVDSKRAGKNLETIYNFLFVFGNTRAKIHMRSCEK